MTRERSLDTHDLMAALERSLETCAGCGRRGENAPGEKACDDCMREASEWPDVAEPGDDYHA